MNEMNHALDRIKAEIYDKCAFEMSNFQPEPESAEYEACQFELNRLRIICRNAKITPKKTGQFVTFWKRNGNGPIEPFEETDPIDFFAVNVSNESEFGQFLFPKSVLIKRGILSTKIKEGKRAFRVYPSWDIVDNKQAEKTQKWQLDYFYTIDELTDLKQVVECFK